MVFVKASQDTLQINHYGGGLARVLCKLQEWEWNEQNFSLDYDFSLESSFDLDLDWNYFVQVVPDGNPVDGRPTWR